MASVKVKFRSSSVGSREGSIYYQILHNKIPRQLLSKHKIYSSEWDDSHSSVKFGDNDERASILQDVRKNIKRDVECLQKIIRRFDSIGVNYSAADVVDEYVQFQNEYSLFNFMGGLIDQLKNKGKIRTAETYSLALGSFRKFRNNDDIMLDCLNSEIMEAYEAWQEQRGITPNTISFYTRILRAMYNRATDHYLIDDLRPFRRVYTGIEKTVKRAISIDAIKKIRNLNLADSPALDFARDMFILSFMLRGMSFIDMAFLRKADKVNNHVSYRRRKTGQQLSIEWTDDMQAILNKYPENESDYLLPIIKRTGRNERCVYRNVGYAVNNSLKTIAGLVGLSIPLTLYVARHSWASAAKVKGISLRVISEGLGHDSETTTQIYLASLDTTEIDRANSLILSSLIE